MDDKTIIDITNLDAEKHAENAAKRVASYSEKLLHHASILSEKEYQKFLLERLEKDNGYVIRKASDFDRYFAVDREMLFKFLEDTQHETMEYLRKIYKSDLEETIVSFINAETTKTRGSLLDVLKHGIEISNQKLELMYTKPATTFNPDLTRKYGQNIFSAMEEVWASDKERIDVVIFLNGLAIIAFELKCNAAGQSYQDAIYQFRTDRSPKTRLFMFKAGTLVNFAMDLEEVYMTTKLAGDATFFLPFNMGNGEGVTAGAGNPAFEDKYSVSYMWEDILTKDTILDLISKFIFVETKEKVDDKTGKIKRSENLIFPRYHQLDVIRKVLADVRENRTAQNYLIQHSAGSGKTNSIAWLAHRLTSLHDEENKIIFDNIIIVTDRVVVDRQLQKAIMGMEHKAGLIRVMDDKCNSADLAIALNGNTKIIATTIQKFPYIVDSVKDLKNKSFAVIIDEAHSSTAGKDMAAVTMSLGSGDQTESDVEDMISSEIKRNGKQANVSIFAFTATPKPTTIQLFGRLNTHGQREAFHVYSMKQAIEEGFILDVLQNYTEYSTFYQLNKEIEDDPRCKTNAQDEEGEEDHRYWFLNANPKIWSMASMPVGEVQDYTLYNDNGNKRRIFQNFLDAKAGDMIIGYESTPVKQVVAILKISAEQDGKSIYFEKVEGLSSPIDYATLKACPELEKMEYFGNPQGSLFKLTKGEYDFIYDMIRDENPAPPAADSIEKYDKEKFLSMVPIPSSSDHGICDALTDNSG